MATPQGIHSTPVTLTARNNHNNAKLTTVTPGTGRIHVNETITLSPITPTGTAGSMTFIDGVLTVATTPT